MPHMPDLPRSYTPAQVAEMFAVSEETVNRWANEGKLAGFKTPGGRWRFTTEQLERAFEAS